MPLRFIHGPEFEEGEVLFLFTKVSWCHENQSGTRTGEKRFVGALVLLVQDHLAHHIEEHGQTGDYQAGDADVGIEVVAVAVHCVSCGVEVFCGGCGE